MIQQQYTTDGHFIVADPKICGGELTFKGTRILVNDVLFLLAQGYDWQRVAAEYDGKITSAAIAEAVELARKSLLKETQELKQAA